MLETSMEDKLLGEGGFGCVFQPEIPCVKNKVVLSKKKPRASTVSKIFILRDKEAIANEYKFAKLVSTWDPKGDFFVVPTKLCSTTPSLVLQNKEANQCSGLHEVLEEPFLPQIVMPNVGVNMVDFLESYRVRNKKNFSLLTWIKLLDNLFRALQIVHDNGYNHMDIKAENVIYDGKKFRLFDFSLSVPQRKLYKNALQEYNINYFIFPLEMFLVYYKKINRCDKLMGCNIYLEFMSGLYSLGKESAIQYLEYHSFDEITHKIFVLEKWIDETPTWYEEIKQQAAKIDVYSIGVLCIDVEHFGVDYSSVSPEIQTRYKAFVKKLSELDFRIRPSLSEAYKLYKQILSK